MASAAVRLLLDTHALIWWFSDDLRLKLHVRDAIKTAERVYVSAVSAYEIALKHGRHRLPEVDRWFANYELRLVERGFEELRISTAHALAAGGLDWKHGDPWDRLLVAQALTEDVTLVSNEELFDTTRVKRLW